MALPGIPAKRVGATMTGTAGHRNAPAYRFGAKDRTSTVSPMENDIRSAPTCNGPS